MKKTLLAAIIAATALVPPAALAQDRGHRGGNRERVQNNENAGGGAQREGRGNWGGGDRGQRAEAQPRPQAQPQQQRSWGGQRSDGGQARGNWRSQQPAQVQAPAQTQQRQEWRGNRGDNGGTRGQWNNGQQTQQRPQAQQQRDWRGGRGDNRGGWNNNDRNDNRGGWNSNNRNDNRGNWNNNRGNSSRWNSGWRSNSRYNWSSYRNSNRNNFRLPRYYAPSGWGYGYRRFGIGFTLNSILFGSQYWINDPFYYRLPEVDGPYRWVRYYNDALLVDIYTGEVVDTVYDIFW